MDTKTYLVREGVGWINGARVPANRIVTLTDAEALYDKGIGRIEPQIAETDGKGKKPSGGRATKEKPSQNG